MRSLFKFKGGVKPPTQKTQSVGEPIAAAPLPSHVSIPLHQSIGGTPRPIVQAGDRVLKGQKIGEADGWISAAVHASTSGTVVHVGPQVVPHPSGLAAPCVVIEPDGLDTWIDRQPVDISALTPEAIREALRDAGVVGLGGAVFPTHGKLTASKTVPMEELVINGAECEPYITCDDLLMRERAEDVVRGAALFRDLLQPKRVLIGIEDNKPEAVAAMAAAVKAVGEGFEVVAVPTRYPAGGAKQLIRVLTGKEVPAAKRSTDLGVQCFNVATAYTAWRALAYGEPVVSRVVTVTGNVERPRNYEVAIGTPFAELLALTGPRADTQGIIMGGPMMGFLVPDAQVPVVKATNCLIAHSTALFPPPPPEMPCIRCGECARACPHELQPFEMYWFSRAKNFGKTQEYNIFDCIECGCCSFVCPSRIPLVQYFRFAKSEIWAREAEKNAAESAKARFEFKQFRDEREKQEKAEKLAKAAAAQAAKKAAEAAAQADAGENPATDVPALDPAAQAEAAKKATIQAAMERARVQREAAQPRNIENLSPTQEAQVASVDARRSDTGGNENNQ
ncbi:MAG TPA: electron transport complex subunit RsxC [Rhodocyclaceae bacterium]|jgi:electron transport complex protein RnfC|nr:electron transport complex subunit RsxC [Rhodocyclaceae bacterium]HNE42122.1 electron transport complex subunit RsxC [Rhodocyclaceae bacterium]HNL21485.1 electron transport complex subunit RsxC [Rhodocyclaceae bacterium]HNM82053.1 electron transport complex subunit RsxC [Rhodocyclaceae bacterium]HNP04724.1 electron transport complex subunit RsxC [Rhodocyclaceae bacterium]